MNTVYEIDKSTDTEKEVIFENSIHLGDGNVYGIMMNKKPYLRVEVDEKKLFDDAVVFQNFLVIGVSDAVYFINLKNMNISEIRVDWYFGYFEIFRNKLYISDASGITAFDENLNEIWSNHNLAVDGVCFNGYESDRYMIINCEMDPPGGWVQRIIDLYTGKEISD